METTDAEGKPAVRSERLLAAETTLAALSEQMAQAYQQNGKGWPREWMQRHAKDREAILRVRNLLMDLAANDGTERRRAAATKASTGKET